MMGFTRRVGPPPPNLISRAFTAMLNRAPLKEWTRLGAGIAITLVFMVIIAAVRFGWTIPTEKQRLAILGNMGWVSGLLLLVAIVSTFDINLKINASKAGFTGDFSHDDEPDATKAHVEGDVVITPEAKQ